MSVSKTCTENKEYNTVLVWQHWQCTQNIRNTMQYFMTMWPLSWPLQT